MSSYTEFIPDLKTGHNIIVPRIYTNGKFLPIHIYIAVDNGNVDMDARITAYVGEGVVGYSIVGMG